MNFIKNIASACLLCGFSLTLAAQSAPKASYNVVPLPQKVTLQQQWGTFALTPQTRIVCGKSANDQKNAKLLQEFVADRTGLTLSIATKRGKTPAIVLSSAEKDFAPEGYRLRIDSKTVSIAASTKAGAFYGIQTLRKSLPHLSEKERAYMSKNGRIALPGVEINDAPRFAYRGTMLDVARHYATRQCETLHRYDCFARHQPFSLAFDR